MKCAKTPDDSALDTAVREAEARLDILLARIREEQAKGAIPRDPDAARGAHQRLSKLRAVWAAKSKIVGVGAAVIAILQATGPGLDRMEQRAIDGYWVPPSAAVRISVAPVVGMVGRLQHLVVESGEGLKSHPARVDSILSARVNPLDTLSYAAPVADQTRVEGKDRPGEPGRRGPRP